MQSRRSQRDFHPAAFEQGHGVLASNGGHEMTSGPPVLGAGYKAPAPSQAWSEDRMPMKFRTNRQATKTDMTPAPGSSHHNGAFSTSPSLSMPLSTADRSSLSFTSQPHFGPSEYQAQNQVARAPPGYPTPQPQPQTQPQPQPQPQTGSLRPYQRQPPNAAYPPNHRSQTAYARPPPAQNQASSASWNGTRRSRAQGGMWSGGSTRNNPGNAGAVVRSFGPAPATSENYKGNANLEANRSHDIPAEESCSLWITNLPANCDVPMLLSRIRDCDKVFATVINSADPANGKPFVAAKVVFWSRRGVDRLMQRHQDGHFAFAYPGVETPPPLRVSLNRILARPMPPSPHCRVLLLKGHRDIVSEAHLRAVVFQDKFVWQDDGKPSVEFECPITHTRLLEWHFGSWRCQAENAYNLLDAHIQQGKTVVGERRDLEKQERDISTELERIYYGIEPHIIDNSEKLLRQAASLWEQLKVVQGKIDGLPKLSDSDINWAAATVIFGEDPCA
ncbi:hypothetical protein PG985_013012 [Apiospora marii]|uniref:RRM domain-containing protein n=1 Tax=Apiospora marii TaxID=335849 RepID=A0ABR1R8N1_9PEZI